MRNRTSTGFKNYWFIGLIILFVIVESAAHIRSAYSGIISPEITFWNWISWIGITSFTFITFMKARANNSAFEYRKAVCYALIVYIVANCFFQLIGFETPNPFTREFPAILLGKFGINTSRTLFPTSVGFNSIGIMGGVASIAGLIFLIQGKNGVEKGFGLLGFLAGFYVIILTDCRGALIFTLLTSLVMIFPFARSFPILKWLAPISLLFPYAMVQIMRVCQGPVWSTFSRSTSGEGANSLLSGRMVIWAAFIDFFKNFQPIHLIGYGFQGQLISKISKHYAHLFLPWSLPETTTAHNFPLQLTIEIGYLGLFLTLALISITLINLGNYALAKKDLPSKTLFFVLIYLLLTGSTESVLTLGHPETQYVLVLILTSTMAIIQQPAMLPEDKVNTSPLPDDTEARTSLNTNVGSI